MTINAEQARKIANKTRTMNIDLHRVLIFDMIKNAAEEGITTLELEGEIASSVRDGLDKELKSLGFNVYIHKFHARGVKISWK